MSKPIEWLGVEQAGRDLVGYGKRVAVASDEVARKVAERIQATTAARVPYVTGNLRGSLETVVVRDGRLVGYSNRAPYAGWIEFGGTRSRPYVPEGRWLWPAADASVEDLVAAVSAAATREANRYPWNKQPMR